MGMTIILGLLPSWIRAKHSGFMSETWAQFNILYFGLLSLGRSAIKTSLFCQLAVASLPTRRKGVGEFSYAAVGSLLWIS